jgi:hypothetical protein
MAEKNKPRRDTAPGDKPEPKPKKRAISENPAASLALVRRARPAPRRS